MTVLGTVTYMSNHTATVSWDRKGAAFSDNQYSRAHRWKFDGGMEVPASSSPFVVRVPMSDPAAVDSEEAFVASLSSCHLLWFLDHARQRGLVVERYEDQAVGVMSRNEHGKLWISRVTLRPAVTFAGRQPDRIELDALHNAAHEDCFIAASVRTEVLCEVR
jgi:organic hydroperoxide reductase OsmC/OhrA